VNRIAGETEEKVMERDAIMRRLATLEKGSLICKQYAKRPQQGSITKFLIDRSGLMDLVPNLSSDETELPELSVSGPRILGNEIVNNHRKSPPTHKRVPESVPKATSTTNIFGHLLASSQIQTGSGSRTPSPSTLQKDTSTVSPKPTSTLFGAAPGLSSNSAFGQPSTISSTGDNADMKPQHSVLFPLTTSAAGGTSPFGLAAAKPASGNSISTGFGSNLFSNLSKNSEAVTPNKLFGKAEVSGGAFGSTSGATTSNPSVGGFGNSSATTQTKSNNNLKWV